jgi:hypothetical protein
MMTARDGTGGNTIELAGRGSEVTATDIVDRQPPSETR